MFFIPRDTRKYFHQGYHCTVGVTKGGCVKQPMFDEFEGTVLSLRELTKEQLDLVILGQLQAITPSSLSSKRKDPPSLYKHRPLRVCRQTFCFIHSISEKRLTASIIHLNVKNLPHNQDFEIPKLSTLKNYASSVFRIPINCCLMQKLETIFAQSNLFPLFNVLKNNWEILLQHKNIYR